MARANVYVSYAVVSVRLIGEVDGAKKEFGLFGLDLVNDDEKDKFEPLLSEIGKIAYERMADQIAAFENEPPQEPEKPVGLHIKPAKAASDIVEARLKAEEKARKEAERAATEEAARVARERAAEINTDEEKK